jgi:two-component system chemotaxis response regulator CheB
VREAEEKQNPLPGYVYFAPPNYHLMIEDDGAFALSVSEKVNYSRPSIDVLFETAAWVHKSDLVGIIMTGANHDGANGLKKIKDNGGLTIVQDPATADVSVMPGAAIQVAEPDYIFSIENIIDFLNNIGYENTR